jgi:hypothetical protein
MKREGDAEMRDEYDFSSGVRGRHAARLTVRERGELLRRSTVQDVQIWISYALTEVQRLEATLFSYLVLTRNQRLEQAGPLAAALLDDRALPSVDQVAPVLRTLAPLDGDFETRFGRVVAGRVWLVRRSGYESQQAMTDHEKTAALLGRLERIVDDASAVKAQIEEALREQLSRTGLSNREIDEKSDKTKELWLAA